MKPYRLETMNVDDSALKEISKATSGSKSGIRMFLDDNDQGQYHGKTQ
jgi:hypothetical protein